LSQRIYSSQSKSDTSILGKKRSLRNF
jgi:hypothetical protein